MAEISGVSLAWERPTVNLSTSNLTNGSILKQRKL